MEVEVFVVYQNGSYWSDASRSEVSYTTIEVVLAKEEDIKTWANEKKLELKYSNKKWEAGSYIIERHLVKTYTTNY